MVMYDAGFGISLKVCCVLVDPSGSVLMLKRAEDRDELSGVYELPNTVLAREDLYHGVNIREEIKKCVFDLTRIKTSKLTTDLFAGIFEGVPAHNGSRCYLTFCAGAKVVAQEGVQIHYDHHNTYRWIDYKLETADANTSVTAQAAECITTLQQNTSLFQELLPEKRAW